LDDLVVDFFVQRVFEGFQAHVDELGRRGLAQVDSDQAVVVEFDTEAGAC